MVRARLWACVVAWTGCAPSRECPPLEEPLPVEVTDPAGRMVAEPTDGAAMFFGAPEVRTIDLDLDPVALGVLDAAPAAEQYVPAQLSVDGAVVGPVGLRYKGSVGAFIGCVSTSTEADPFNLSGSKTCPKLSYKVSLNEIEPEQTLFGMRKLLLHALHTDPSMLREHLGYRVFREAGVPASRTAYVRVRVNRELQGVFLAVEDVDGRFTRSHFSDGEGNLYKDLWPAYRRDATLPVDATRALAALETNEDEGPDVSRLVAFADELADAAEVEDADVRAALVARGLSVDHVARYIAADRAVRHDDGPLHFYAPIGPGGSHNVYVYEEAADARWWLIPWDLDRAFAVDTDWAGSGDAFSRIAPRWDDTDGDCGKRTANAGAWPQVPCACDPLIGAFACGWRGRVRAESEALWAGPLAEAAVSDWIDAQVTLLTPLVRAQNEADPRNPTVEAWLAGVEDLRARIAWIRADAEDALSPSP